MSSKLACGDPLSFSGGTLPYSSGTSIVMAAPFKSIMISDQVTGEVYELVVRDGKMELLATSQQGIRQQKIEKVIE
jgi:hypothetical protein